jgi:hypothetical protein
MTRDEHRALISDVIARAADSDLCDVVVIGIKPKGGLYVDWSGTSVASLVLYIEAAKAEAVKAFAEKLP